MILTEAECRLTHLTPLVFTITIDLSLYNLIINHSKNTNIKQLRSLILNKRLFNKSGCYLTMWHYIKVIIDHLSSHNRPCRHQDQCLEESKTHLKKFHHHRQCPPRQSLQHKLISEQEQLDPILIDQSHQISPHQLP